MKGTRQRQTLFRKEEELQGLLVKQKKRWKITLCQGEVQGTSRLPMNKLLPLPWSLFRSAMVEVFTPKFKNNAGIRSFQDCVIEESIRCESVSADLDAMSESTIL